MEKTTKQLEEMYRDLMGTKCVDVEVEAVRQFVAYCKNQHGVTVYGGALTDDGKRRYVYVD